jgi:glycosidase
MRSPLKHLPLALMALALGCVGVDAPASSSFEPGTPEWTARSAIYEVFVRDFSQEGTFRGVTDGLDRIESVGAEVVWLMPIHPIGEVERKGPLGSPYSVTDYRAINPDFGSADDFRALVHAVQARGMKLIIDWVPNHTAWDHVWVSEHPEFYARDEHGQMTVPRDLDGNLTDWTDVVELDYGNPAMRRAMIADMRYWLDQYGIDGFRVDVAGFVPDDFWREAIPELRAHGPILLLAEWGDLRMHELGFDLTYGWDSYHRLKAVWRGRQPASYFVESEIDELRGMPAGGLRLRFTTNHDETAWDAPPVTLFGGRAAARAAFAAMALLPGTPLIYNGQEVESAQTLGLFVRDAVEWDQPDAEQARAFYRRVVELSRTHDAFVTGGLEIVETSAPEDVIAYRRGDAIVLVNTRDHAVSFTLHGVDVDDAQEMLGGGMRRGEEVTLAPYGVLVAVSAVAVGA